MKILNQSNLDELIKRSADMDLLRQELEDDEEELEEESEFSEVEWQDWLQSMDW